MDSIDEELVTYEEVYRRPAPIKYDVLRLNEEHRRMDALVRRFWRDFHPLVRDIFTSFASEFQYLIHMAEEVEGKKNEEIASLKLQTVEQLDSLNSMLDKLKSEYEMIISERDVELSELLEQQESLQKAMQAMKSELEEKDKLIGDQDRKLSDLGSQISKKSSQNALISKTLENVSEYTIKLEELENDTRVLESEKDELEKENEKLKENIQQLENAAVDPVLLSRVEELEKQNNELRTSMKRGLDLATGMKLRYQELKDQYDELDEDYKQKTKLLNRQIAINKEYHVLTLKILEQVKSRKKPTTSKLTTKPSKSVPDLVSQLKLHGTGVELQSIDNKLEDLGRRPEPEVQKTSENLDQRTSDLIETFKKKINDTGKGIPDMMQDFPSPPKKSKKPLNG